MVELFTTGELEITIEREGRQTRAILVGQLDETAQLADFGARVDGELVLDLAQVSFINSLGVREWIRLLRDLDARGIRPRLRRCSEAMVHQMNMIVDAKGGGIVESFFAPYVCERCGRESSMCIVVASCADLLRTQAVPALPCPDCHSPMTLNELVERYLLFLD